MLAVTNEGKYYFSFLQGKNNTYVMLEYFQRLMDYLDHFRPGWRETHTLLLDNAKLHKTSEFLRKLELHEIKTCFTGVASFNCLPVERVFCLLKRRNQDMDKIKTSFWRRNPQLKKKPTQAQYLMFDIACKIRGLTTEKIKGLFFSRMPLIADYMRKPNV